MGLGWVPGVPLTLLCPQLRTDSEKRSLAESGLSWYGEGDEKAPKKLDYDSSSLKMEHGSSKWRREPSEGGEEGPKGGELKKPVSLGTPGSLKKGKTPPVAVTSPITHTAQSALKVAGKNPFGQGPAPLMGRRLGGVLVCLPQASGPSDGCAQTWELGVGWKGGQGCVAGCSQAGGLCLPMLMSTHQAGTKGLAYPFSITSLHLWCPCPVLFTSKCPQSLQGH